MSAPNNGGPAYPNPVEFDPNGQVISHGTFGMSIRTAIAMRCMAASENPNDYTLSVLKKFAHSQGIGHTEARAKAAWIAADLLIAEGTKDGGVL